MINLKTLKDLDDYGEIQVDNFKGDLKAEAIKDYKQIKLKKKKWTRKDVLNYIKWKNNLTEEDLKNKLAGDKLTGEGK